MNGISPEVVQFEDSEGRSSLRVIGTDNYITEVAKAGNITYVGDAVPGSLTSDPVWRISRITTSGSDVSVKYADSNSKFDNIWDNRGALIYG